MTFRAIGLLLCGSLLMLATMTGSPAAAKKGVKNTKCQPGVLTCRKAGGVGGEIFDRWGNQPSVRKAGKSQVERKKPGGKTGGKTGYEYR